MADEAPIPVAPAAPAPAPAAAAPAPAPTPAAAAPAPTPAPAESAPAPTAAAEPAPAAPAPAEAAPAPAEAEAPETLLSEAGKTPAEPPAEVKPVEPPAPAELGPLPTYEPFKTPEGVTLGEKEVGQFSELLGSFERDLKVPHEKAAEFGQKLVDFYAAEVTRMQQAQAEAFTKIRDDWRQQFSSDPDLGGNRANTTLAAAGSLIEQYGGTPEQIAEVRKVLRLTGAGDHPALIRLFRNAGRSLAQEGKPVPATVPKSPAAIPKSQRRYPSLNNGAN